MDIPTLVLTMGFNGYLAWLGLWAARDVVGIGPIMVFGLVAAFGGLLIGEIAVVSRMPMFREEIAAVVVTGVVLIGYALWRRRRRARRVDSRDGLPAPRE